MAFEGNITAAISLLKGLKPETFRDRIEQINIQDIDPNKVPPELLDKIANRMIEQALAKKGEQCIAETIAEVDRRLLAGESVTTVESVCQAVNGPTRTALEPEESRKL